MPKTLGIWEWRCPKRGDAQNALTPGGFWERETNPLQFRRDNRQQVGEKCYILCRICGQDRAIYGLSHGFYHWKGLFLVLWHFQTTYMPVQAQIARILTMWTAWLNDLASAYKYFISQVSLTPARKVSSRSLLRKEILSYILLKKMSLLEVQFQ